MGEPPLDRWSRFLNLWLALSLCASSATRFRARASLGWGEIPLLLGLILLFGTLVWQRQRPSPQAWPWLGFGALSTLLLTLGAWQAQRLHLPGLQPLKGILAFNFAWLGPILMLSLPQPHLRVAHFENCWLKLGGAFFLTLGALSLGWDWLWFHGYRFAGLCANPNQTALFLLALPILAVRQWKGPIGCAGIAALLWIGFSTGSDALILAWWCQALLELRNKRRAFAAALLVVTCLWVSTASRIRPAADLVQLTSARASLQTRIDLVRHGLQAASHSPLVGWGPGAFSGEERPFQRFEAHNSLIDWATNSGYLGLLAYLGLLGTLIQRPQSGLNPAILIFSLFHFVFRMPVFWFGLLKPLGDQITGQE